VGDFLVQSGTHDGMFIADIPSTCERISTDFVVEIYQAAACRKTQPAVMEDE